MCEVEGCRHKDTHTTSSHRCGKCHKYGHGQMECGKRHKIQSLQNFLSDELPPEKYCAIPGCRYKKYHQTNTHHCNHCSQNHSSNNCPIYGVNNNKVKCPLCRTDNEFVNMKEQIKSSELCCVCLTNKVSRVLPKCKHTCLCNDCFTRLIQKDKATLKLSSYIYNEERMNTFCNIVDIKHKLNKCNKSKAYCITYAGMGCSLYIRRDFDDGALLGFLLHSDCQGQYGINHIPFVQMFISGYKLVEVS